MCTAISFNPKGHYFGRTLDLEYHYNETVTVTPKGFNFSFSTIPHFKNRYSIIGMATVCDGYPLYYDAMNEKGLAMAGLNFPDNAFYGEPKIGTDNVASFEFIPWVLSQCENLGDVLLLLKNINICNFEFNEQYPASPLHWMITDKEKTITVEPLKDGLKIHENRVGVLTNNPPFSYHLYNLSNFINLTNDTPQNQFGAADIDVYSRGLGAVGLPGDYSSASRFIKAAFVKGKSVCGGGKQEEINQFFHILGSVAQPRGCVKAEDGRYVFSIYTSCCDLDKGVYYYSTYENSTVNGVALTEENSSGDKVTSYPLI